MAGLVTNTARFERSREAANRRTANLSRLRSTPTGGDRPRIAMRASPAKAGVQLGRLRLADDSRNYSNFPDWAPAFAGEARESGAGRE